MWHGCRDAGPHVRAVLHDEGASQGTGLGLATVYGIVSQSGGSVEVSSEPGHGTTFKIYLPRIEDTPATVSASPPSPRLRAGAGRVFLVEDEEGVRELTRSVLEDAGYTVVTASNGREALEVFAAHGGAFDLLMTDVVMPYLDGRRLAERLLAQRPEIRVIYMSGYASHTMVHDALLDPGTAFVRKPFTVTSLTARVREMLDPGEPVSELVSF